MRSIQARYDVAVIGGGPVGSVAAIAFARRGARVLVLEADPRACRRFAGEWIHPAGVAVLDALRAGRLEKARPLPGYGFVIFPDDGSAPIELPYPAGVALACPHEDMVECLREEAAAVRGVDVVSFARVVELDGTRIVAEERPSGRRLEVLADRIVGADGRSSFVRRAMGLPENSAVLSYMASVELRDVELPVEGFGHVILGGPGPALVYRIADGRIRGCLDVPLRFGAASRTPAFLWDAWSSVLPASLVPAFRRALEEGPVAWAATRFRPRGDFGRGPVALVGDALGHAHPMTALGLSNGFLDAEALAASKGLDEYARARRSYVPELLTNALYHCFRREDASATALRQATFRVLRASSFERRRTMQILSGEEVRAASFGSVFLRVAAGAVGSTMADAARPGGLSALPAALSSFAEWMQWPAAAILPGALRDAYRAESTSTHPIPLLRELIRIGEAPPISQAKAAEPSKAIPRPPAPKTAEAMARATDLLIRELESIAMQLGSLPDSIIAGPAMRMMRAITATEMRSGVAARMTLGRRWLANDGIPRLLAQPGYETSDLAEVLLVLRGGSSWSEARITGLEAGVTALLGRELGDLRTTALACRALAAVKKGMPAEQSAAIDAAIERAVRRVRSMQSADGSFGATAGEDRLAATSWALEALSVVDGAAGEPAVRRAAGYLCSLQGPSGAFSNSLDPSPARSTARALRALLSARAPHTPTIDAGVAMLCAAIAGFNPDEPPSFAAGNAAHGGPAPAAWEEHWEILEVLGLYEAQKKARPEGAVRAARAVLPATPLGDADWVACRERLGEVSRSFARPISMLPRHLEIAVSLGYLLCRVADTIEDHPAVPGELRAPLMATFLEVLSGRTSPTMLAAAFADVPGDDAELGLSRDLPTVMRVFRAQPEATRASSIRWISEMGRGMALYGHREPGADGIVALHTESDLERYCYFVAGTVGHLLTDLFLAEIGDEVSAEVALTLRVHAEAFGAGLQLVNILKDLTDDRARKWSYIPRTTCAARGLGVAELPDPSRRAAAHAAVAPLFDAARKHLDDGLTYALAIPPEHAGIRRFCLLPLYMAARTLVLARGSDAMFTAGEAVKITREEVESLAAACVAHTADDAALRAAYAALWTDERAGARSAG